LEKATQLDPELVFGFLNLGKALAATGKGKEADEAFEKAFKLSPEIKALAQAAEFFKKGLTGNAEKITRKIIQENPNNVDAFRLLGIISARNGIIGDAERFFRKAIDIAPDFTLLIIYLLEEFWIL